MALSLRGDDVADNRLARQGPSTGQMCSPIDFLLNDLIYVSYVEYGLE